MVAFPSYALLTPDALIAPFSVGTLRSWISFERLAACPRFRMVRPGAAVTLPVAVTVASVTGVRLVASPFWTVLVLGSYRRNTSSPVAASPGVAIVRTYWAEPSTCATRAGLDGRDGILFGPAMRVPEVGERRPQRGDDRDHLEGDQEDRPRQQVFDRDVPRLQVDDENDDRHRDQHCGPDPFLLGDERIASATAIAATTASNRILPISPRVVSALNPHCASAPVRPWSSPLAPPCHRLGCRYVSAGPHGD